MKKFHYKAQGPTGVVIDDIIDAENQESAIEKIRATGATPVSISEEKKKNLSINIPFLDNMLHKVKIQDKVVFAKNLSRMLQAGLTVSRSLEVLKKQTDKTEFVVVLDSLIAEINSGGSLSGGMAKNPKVFSPVFVAMVRTGEESGNIPGNLIEVAKQLDKTYALRKKIKGAMIYPSVIVSAMMVIGVLMFIFVVPTLIQTFKDFDLDLPATTRAVVFVSDLVSNSPLVVLGVLVGVVVSAVSIFRMKSLQPHFDLLSTKLPIVGTIVKEFNSALATRTLASLLGSGLNINQALTVTKDVLQNFHYKKTIDVAIHNVEQGDQLSKVFKDNIKLYPVMVGEMISVGEETGNLSDMLGDVAEFFEDEVDSKTKNLSTIIEPVLMLLVGAGVGFF
ncbi:MAG: type II secretion system F family protein, partial [Nitrosopumilus sp.]|nr:type II secretion system F family protein [Nitrosopumilus sp.]